MKIKEVLKDQVEKLNRYPIEDAILKAQILLQHVLGVSHEYLTIHYEDKIDKQALREFQRYIGQLINGRPIQYIVNSQNFYGYQFYVDENVLIPQPDTEILVEEVIRIGPKEDKKLKILDICTGSGAIAISIRKNLECTMYASDISESALEIARKNAVIHHAEVSLLHSNMFEKIEGKFDRIVSNPPYIETSVIKDLSEEVKNEPEIALDGGEDGLKFYRILADEARNYLEKDGILAVEIGFNQKEKVMRMLEEAGFCEVYSKKDFGGNDRIVVGKWR